MHGRNKEKFQCSDICNRYDSDAIEKARIGAFPGIESDVSKKTFEPFFLLPKEIIIIFRKEIREMMNLC